MIKQPLLVGKKLSLRPFEASDIGEEYLGWLNDPEVTRYLGVGREPVTLESVRRYVERFQHSTTDLLFAIIDRKTNKHIGNVTLNHIHPIHRTADTGLMIGDKAFWGKGYAFETWTLLIDFAFTQLGLRKIIAGAVAGHEGSLLVLKRLGFRQEGVFRGEFFLDGIYLDTLRMGLFQREFKKPDKEIQAEPWTSASLPLKS